MREIGERNTTLCIGVDVGSTTTKIAAMDGKNEKLLYSSYDRHHAMQLDSVCRALTKAKEQLPDVPVRLVFTGSGARGIADYLGVPFIQEVVANSLALKKHYPTVRTAIELGGQDAKMIFFKKDTRTDTMQVADMRMNGSCAGGTGAFIDEIASLLRTPVEEFHTLAAGGRTVYDISGRCGVYAKTDIQPLLNQGVSPQDIALSSYHAIAKQTIGGLAQGLDIEKPVAFEGGPFQFHPELVQVFAERLELEKDDIILPKKPEIMVAYGAALSLLGMFKAEATESDLDTMLSRLEEMKTAHIFTSEREGQPFFTDIKDREAFDSRHAAEQGQPFAPALKRGTTLHACLGIDSGSTTTKFVLMDMDGALLDSFYASNEGSPLKVARQAMLDVLERYTRAGVKVVIDGVCTTGYGENLFARALPADCHIVETVAHAKATAQYVEDASFILDIGGQDMKAIWIDHGIITNIVVNEACSSGCGSFLENFAATLGIPVKKIAETAFASENPAVLGSRCTVFMNSSIVTEQRNGKDPGDIMAGLCRSIIENVFTKVIRLQNLDSLGDRIVVQGGTFQNDAVLRALEQYTGKEVIRAPYPGIMGAIGAAMTAREWALSHKEKSAFAGLEAMRDFTFTQEANVPCPFCTNHCKRSVITFSNGNSWVTNNRCERGEILGDVKDASVRTRLQEKKQSREKTANLYELRKKLLFETYEVRQVSPDKDITIGIPRVLSFWDTMPFWTTFWKSLGFSVKVSGESTRKKYENGLKAVVSDTVCFPAKLVHGHIRELEKMGVDRIFFPSITTVPPENQEKTSESMCAVVKGYPLVIKNSDNPDKRKKSCLEAPLFHWCSDQDRKTQLCHYMKETFGVPEKETALAIEEGQRAEDSFKRQLTEAGAKVLQEVTEKGTYAVVLASRPYQNDTLVNHDLPGMFVEEGIPVLTADALPDLDKVPLDKSRLDVVNNYHGRMLASAVMAAQNPHLQYVQIVSFGCGHDAYLSDEIQRMMKEISGKIPLILKLDESDVAGPLRIRVRSFIETVNMRLAKEQQAKIHSLSDPYPVKFEKRDQKEKVVLVPNTSHAFSRVMAAAMKHQGLRTVSLPIGREAAIRFGKQYVHNDICFPAQIVIGEVLAALKSGAYDPDNTAVAMGKYIGDCRLTHYGALLRKALDDAGFSQVPILTNDDVDARNMHPGYRMDMKASLGLAFAMPMIDALEELLRKMRPYELVEGAADKAFEEAMDVMIEGLETHGAAGALQKFKTSIEIMKKVPYDRSKRRPTVLIVGEYLLNFHPGANHDIEAYLESHGFEIIEAKMTDVIQKSYFSRDMQNREYKLKKPFHYRSWNHLANRMFDVAHSMTDRIAAAHPLYQKAERLSHLVEKSDDIIYHTFDAGEGVLIPAEILHHAEEGCRTFVILQPFGCLPNHVVGRGISKRLKELYPDAQILPLDYDPDVSFANVENRLQMLIMNQKDAGTVEKRKKKKKTTVTASTAAKQLLASCLRE